jgi:topoisomerase-4 subunit A
MGQIDQLFDLNFIEYASYVIKDRAIPHIDDGLKPVQRRILHSLFEMDDGKYHKVANVVGHCMKYHPHGDASIYSALVVIANKNIFIDKQGNFGNIYTGDPASAARYIECRSTPFGKDSLYNPNITEYVDSYDSRNREPVTFPAKLPVLLAQGTEGIAVGMSTKIMPHNLIELLENQIKILKDEPFEIFPDFPTGGLIDVSGYEDGMGKVMVRAKVDISDPKKVIIKDIPFGVTTEALIESIEGAARKGKIKLSSIQDFTAEKVEIEIKLMRGVSASDVVDALYAFTDCELSISSNIIVIRDDKPVQLLASEVLRHNTERLVDILTKELHHEAGQLEDKLHAKNLEQIFIENRIYKAIEEQKTSKAVIESVFKGLEPFQDQIKREVTAEDVDTLLKIPIRRISLYDINKAQKEMTDIRRRLREIKKALADMNSTAIGYLENIIEKQRDNYPRMSTISNIQKVDVREAAIRDLKLSYDGKTGFLGYKVKGDQLLEVSQYDRVLVIRKEGKYSVINAPEKLFVEKGMRHCGFIDKDIVYNIVYRDKKTQFAYIKRCKIEKFILDREYELIPEGATILAFGIGQNFNIHLDYKPKERAKIHEQDFALSDFPIRGLKANGLKLSNRETKKAKFAKALTVK